MTQREDLDRLRRRLWVGVADQTWCLCIGEETGDHIMVLDGWSDETARLSVVDAEKLAAKRLYDAGCRPNMSYTEIEAIFTAPAHE